MSILPIPQDQSDDFIAKSAVRLGFFEKVFGTDLDGYICVATTDPRSPKTTFSQRFFEWPSQSIKLEEWILSVEKFYNVYFCVSLLKVMDRKKSACLPSRVLWSDLDEINPDVRLASEEEAAQGIGSLPPTIIVRSSPGRWQAYWRVTPRVDPWYAEDYSRRIAYFVGADKSGWDMTQLLRIPFTQNFKYRVPVAVELEHAADTTVSISVFDKLPTQDGLTEITEKPVPEGPHSAEEIIYKYKSMLEHSPFFSLWHQEPDESSDWSSVFWAMLNTCFRIGMSVEEVFVIGREAKCNKYIRDHRPIDHMWRDILKAAENYKNVTTLSPDLISMPTLISDSDLPKDDNGNPLKTFIDEYRAWGAEATDAVPDFHDLSIFVVLSAIIAMSVKIETSAGDLTPNLWGMILGDSTLTRKAQPLDAKLLTPAGWIRMADVKVGDYVIGKNGQPTKVTGISPRITDDCYEMVFSDGARTQCSANHLWNVKRRGKNAAWMTRTLGEIITTGYDSKDKNYQIPMTDPVFQEKSELPVEPYLLGLLLGDGHFADSGQIRISSIDDEIIEHCFYECEKLGIELKKVPGDQCDFRLTVGPTHGHGWQGTHNPLSMKLTELGLRTLGSHQKFIPKQYLYASKEDRLAILQGLMDTDGWTNRGAAYFASSSPELALDVQYLVRSLGGWANMTIRSPWKKGTYHPIHQIYVSMPMGINPFRLARKSSVYDNRSWARPRRLADVNYIGKKEMQCIRVAAEDGLYVTDDFIVTHNSTCMRLAMDYVMNIDPELVVATDGTSEGILSALALRPHKSSIFFKDEISGLFDSMGRKDYLAGLQETLTALYDAPAVFSRRLRKETIMIESPAFVFIGGGVTERVYATVDESYVLSGFLPRFLVVYGEGAVETRRPLGPPTEAGLAARPMIFNKIADMYETYAGDVDTKIGGSKVRMPPRIKARLSPEAWKINAEFEGQLLTAGTSSLLSDLALPTFDRMSKSLLKMACILACLRQKPVDNSIEISGTDLIQAAHYITRWGQNSVNLLLNAGKGTNEKLIDKAIQFVQENPGTSKSNLMRRFHLSGREAIGLIETLEERDLVKTEKRGKGQVLWVVQ